MASTINASTSPAAIVQTADGTANLSLQSNGTTIAALTSTGMAVTGTLSASGAITATGGVVVGAAAAPAFSAYRSTTQSSVSANTWTKCNFQTEDFDTNSNYDNATNYRFTPTVAGYYQINVGVDCSATGVDPIWFQVAIYKNGTEFKTSYLYHTTVTLRGSLSVGSIIYFNGSTDYVEGYGFQSASATGIFTGTTSGSYINGCMVRSA